MKNKLKTVPKTGRSKLPVKVIGHPRRAGKDRTLTWDKELQVFVCGH